MTPREVRALIIGTDRMVSLSRLDDGYVSGVIAGNIEADDKYIPGKPETIKTKIVTTTELSNCIALCIQTNKDIFILHVSPSQAQAKKEWNSMSRYYVEPYSQLKGELKGSVTVSVFGHVETFNEQIFKNAMQAIGVEVEKISIVAPRTNGLLIATFNFEKNTVEIAEEAVPGNLNPKKRVWSLVDDREAVPQYSDQMLFKQKPLVVEERQFEKQVKHGCCVIL